MSSVLFGNGTNVVHWKPNPNTRGTFDILSTCIITMLLCVWTAVHLNVSPPGSVWRPRFRKVGWLILALLAPEMIAYTAWYQRREARSIMCQVNKAYDLPNPQSWRKRESQGIEKATTKLKMMFVPGKKEFTRQPTLEAQKSSSPEGRHPWTMVHGFYAFMGGIAFEIPESLPESKRFLPSNTSETWFLSRDRISLLSKVAEKGIDRDVFPDLSQEEIESKSKANGLAKALVCVQALWFIAQCLTRLAQRIPISLLELNTFGHAICALLIYLLWWEKPFEVDYPTMIKGQILWDLRALIYMRRDSRSSVVDSFNRDLRAYLEGHPWFSALSKQEQALVQYPIVERDLIRYYNDGSDSEQETDHNGDNETGSKILAARQNLQGIGFKARDVAGVFYFLGPRGDSLKQTFLDSYEESDPHLPKISLTARDVTRWRMAWRAASVHGLNYGRSDSWFWPNRKSLVRRCTDWPDESSIFDKPSIALGFSAAALIYGGLHALAWFAHFDTPTEQLLWRLSVCVVMGGVPVIFAILKIETKPRRVSEFHTWIGFVPTFLYVLASCVLLPAYILARAYLVVECFINLSHLPAGVYDVPSWSTYFPHIS